MTCDCCRVMLPPMTNPNEPIPAVHRRARLSEYHLLAGVQSQPTLCGRYLALAATATDPAAVTCRTCQRSALSARTLSRSRIAKEVTS